MRQPIIAGNWKMYKTAGEAEALIRELIPAVAGVAAEVVVCPTFTSLDRVARLLARTNIALGAQNVYWEKEGAFTGEIAPAMLKDLGVAYVIVGHSERRQFFGETDATVNRRALAVLANGMKPIICVGERLEEREADKTSDVVTAQIKGGLAGFTREQMLSSVVAYEPVWAIGTGKVASPDQAQEVHKLVRDLLGQLFGAETAAAIRIQYGGSVKPDNAVGLLGQPDIDGALVGGASLKADSFAAIVKAARVK
ncbi:triose-phosphate isomerase [Candidatus Sumerlaeota bacterium]|nr:triose-phosphate isomerase [Candidatus Sumerlaeota bacterium]